MGLVVAKPKLRSAAGEAGEMAVQMPHAVLARGEHRFEELKARIGLGQEARFQPALRTFIGGHAVEHDAGANAQRAATQTG